MLKDGKPYELERDEAIRLHLEMWTDMQKELGDDPCHLKRVAYKGYWLIAHGYKCVYGNCFLCEYARQAWHRSNKLWLKPCEYCPIDWSSLSLTIVRRSGMCSETYKNGVGEIYLHAPISEILELPQKEAK